MSLQDPLIEGDVEKTFQHTSSELSSSLQIVVCFLPSTGNLAKQPVT